MRTHTVAAIYVAGFSVFFGLGATEYAVLFLTFGLVLCAEVVNTSIERLCDRDTEGFSQWARVVKDTAAGAVLVCALFAVGVGVCLFWKPEVFPVIWKFFTVCWWRLAPKEVFRGVLGAPANACAVGGGSAGVYPLGTGADTGKTAYAAP